MCKTSSSRNLFIAFAIAAAFSARVPAFAGTAIVVDRNLPPEVKVSGTEFDVDERTGRARLAVDFYDNSWDGYLTSESVAVPGLRFDRERGEVLYESAGSVVTCATRKKILWANTYPATGACRVVVKSERRSANADSGAAASTNWIVELVTDEPAKAASLSRPRGR